MTSIQKAPVRFLASMFLAVSTLTAAHAQTPMQARLLARPLTPHDIEIYGLPGDTEVSGGLWNVGVGQPLYLEADVNIALPAADITNVTWSLVSAPSGSKAALTTSPLESNVPVFGPSDQLVYQVAGRTLLRPDLAGQYTVTLTIATANEGTTNLTQTITAGTYMGINTCSLCHSGGLVADNMVVPWQTTGHAHIFSEGIDGLIYSHYDTRCAVCHTVGYDTNTNAVNGGFDDVAAELGWTFPTNLVPGNWASMQSNYPSLANLANIQCENCHGPGSQHAALLGATNAQAWPSVAVSFDAGVCAQCHDEPPHHSKVAEWDNSVHAVTTRHPAGEASCVGCHTGKGFVQRMEGITNNIDTSYVPINCQTCHEPHGETIPDGNPHLIRAMTSVTLMDGTVVTNAGEGLLCMQCHHSRQDAAVYAATAPASRYFGPHHGPQGDMLEGVNGFTYGQAIPSSAHRTAVTNLCVTCHMQSVASSDPDFTRVGGHTFKPGWEGDTNHPAEDLVGACQQCHGSAVTDFDFPLQDYDGDGVIEGVQTEVQHLLDKLSILLPPVGTVKSSLSIDSTWTRPQLEAAYNWQFVNNDGSRGIHNTAYAVGLLKASLANLTGVTVPGGLPDAWVLQYFNSVNDPNAAPNADPTGDGIPNWIKYALGLNPLVAGTTVTNGVVWDNVTALGDTNVVHIYTAAEVTFDTEAGKYYQIQAIGSLSGGWQDVGAPIQGTGNSISYLTPTRNGVQQFFRVMTTTSP
ncbi:MAG: hypothetical protein KGJ60_08890 [Verrucomicrobiota bacterium]|nr:hypothetical protein [Verrucomicrobiota bacterium]